jgi:hypothetical protein
MAITDRIYLLVVYHVKVLLRYDKPLSEVRDAMSPCKGRGFANKNQT